MSRGPDFFGFALHKITRRLLSSPRSSLGLPQEQVVSSLTPEQSAEPAQPEVAVSVSSEQSPKTDQYSYANFENLADTVRKLNKPTRLAILNIHDLIMYPPLQALLQSDEKSSAWNSFYTALSSAETQLKNLGLPTEVLAGFRLYYDLLSRLYSMRYIIAKFAANPTSEILDRQQDFLPISSDQSSIPYGILVLFLFDLRTALEGKNSLSFPDLVKLIPQGYLHANGRDRPLFSFHALLSTLYIHQHFPNVSISDEFITISKILLEMCGYLPTLTREEQLAFLDLYQADIGFNPSEEQINKLTDPQLQDRIRAIPTSTRVFLGHVNDLFASYSGLFKVGLGPVVGYHKHDLTKLYSALQVLPPDFWTPTSDVKRTSRFGNNQDCVLGIDGQNLVLDIRRRGMYYDANGNFLSNPNVTLPVALELARSGSITSWYTWAKKAVRVRGYYDTILMPFLSQDKWELTIEGVYEAKEAIKALYSSTEGYLRYLAFNFFSAPTSYILLNRNSDSWSCVKKIQELINKGLVESTYTLWYLAPFALDSIQEVPFYVHRLRNLLVSSILLDVPLLKEDPERYFELRKRILKDSSPTVGGLILSYFLPFSSSIFHPSGGVLCSEDGQVHKHVLTYNDLCHAAGVEIRSFKVGNVDYLYLAPSSQQLNLKPEILSAINDWVRGATESSKPGLRYSAWGNYLQQPEIYEMVLLFLAAQWFPNQQSVRVIPSSTEPGDLAAKIRPVVYDGRSILVQRAPLVAGPVYGQGDPLQLFEETMRVVTGAPYATILSQLPPHIRSQVDFVLKPSLYELKPGSNSFALDPKTLRPVYVIRSPNPNFQDPTPLVFGQEKQPGFLPKGFMTYAYVMGLPARMSINIVDALVRGNDECRVIYPGSDEAQSLRAPLPPCDCHLTRLATVVYNCSPLLIREAIRLARKSFGDRAPQGSELMAKAAYIWFNQSFFDKCCSPADLHRCLDSLEGLPPDLKQLLMRLWNITLQKERVQDGIKYEGSLVPYREILDRLGSKDPELQEMFQSGQVDRVVLETGVRVAGDFVPSVGLSAINTIVQYIARSGEQFTNFMVRDAYRFAAPPLVGFFLYQHFAPLYPYYPLELLFLLILTGGGVWGIIPMWQRRNSAIQAVLSGLHACASGCAVYDSKLDVAKQLQDFLTRIRTTYS